jgi:hypothetical protein
MKEYQLARGWKVFMVVVCAGMMVGAVTWLASLVGGGLQKNVYMIALPFLLFAASMWFLKMSFELKVVLTGQSIRVTENGKTRELPFTQIKGFSVNEKNTVLEPTDPGKPKIEISNKVENYEELQFWARRHFKNLDRLTVEEEEKEILHNKKFGRSEKDRELNLQKAKRIGKIFNVIGYTLMLWAFIDPRPYELVCGLCFIFPFVAYIPYRYFHGLLKVNPQKNTAYGDISSLLITPLVFVVRALFDYEIIDYANLWLPTVILATIFTVLLAYKSPEFAWSDSMGKAVLFFTAVIALAYGYAISVFYNCYDDATGAQTYYAQVVDKHASTGKRTTYYLKLSPWGRKIKAEDVNVDSELYHRCYEGKTVSVNVRQGRLNAPWYFITD